MRAWILLIAAVVFGVALAEGWQRSTDRRDALDRREVLRLARSAAIAEGRAADRAWVDAHLGYTPRTYVFAGCVRTLGLASAQRADALRNFARTGAQPTGALVSNEWRVPFELQDDRRHRLEPERWAHFDRAVQALAAIGSSEDSSLQQLADATRRR
jgi:hypothetical protein